MVQRVFFFDPLPRKQASNHPGESIVGQRHGRKRLLIQVVLDLFSTLFSLLVSLSSFSFSLFRPSLSPTTLPRRLLRSFAFFALYLLRFNSYPSPSPPYSSHPRATLLTLHAHYPFTMVRLFLGLAAMATAAFADSRFTFTSLHLHCTSGSGSKTAAHDQFLSQTSHTTHTRPIFPPALTRLWSNTCFHRRCRLHQWRVCLLVGI